MRKWTAHWWGSRTSNPVWGANTVPGGFDSHALPPNYLFSSGYKLTLNGVKAVLKSTARCQTEVHDPFLRSLFDHFTSVGLHRSWPAMDQGIFRFLQRRCELIILIRKHLSSGCLQTPGLLVSHLYPFSRGFVKRLSLEEIL